MQEEQSTAARGNPRESATETIPPSGKGEKSVVRAHNEFMAT